MSPYKDERGGKEERRGREQDRDRHGNERLTEKRTTKVVPEEREKKESKIQRNKTSRKNRDRERGTEGGEPTFEYSVKKFNETRVPRHRMC